MREGAPYLALESFPIMSRLSLKDKQMSLGSRTLQESSLGFHSVG